MRHAEVYEYCGCRWALWMQMGTADAADTELVEVSKHRSYAAMPAPCGLGCGRELV